jgi:hypothetical protein
VQIDKDMILGLLKERGQPDKAAEADQQLPDKVDPQEHSGLLERLGVNPQDLIGKVTGGGGLGGLLGKK